MILINSIVEIKTKRNNITKLLLIVFVILVWLDTTEYKRKNETIHKINLDATLGSLDHTI